MLFGKWRMGNILSVLQARLYVERRQLYLICYHYQKAYKKLYFIFQNILVFKTSSWKEITNRKVIFLFFMFLLGKGMRENFKFPFLCSFVLKSKLYIKQDLIKPDGHHFWKHGLYQYQDLNLKLNWSWESIKYCCA